MKITGVYISMCVANKEKQKAPEPFPPYPPTVSVNFSVVTTIPSMLISLSFSVRNNKDSSFS